jgi:hypothetical protein
MALKFRLLETVRIGGAGGARPRPNGGGVLFEEELVFAGKDSGVYNADACQQNIGGRWHDIE